MKDWLITPLDPAPRVTVEPATPVLSDAVAARVHGVWQEAIAARPTLYDGRVFCATSISPATITGYWCPYSRVLTQMRAPSLFAELELRSLAVTALLLCPEGAVLGRRVRDAIYQPGCWQGVPAGSVESRPGPDATAGAGDEVDLVDQLAEEFAEELGLDRAALSFGPAILAAEHTDTHIVDIAFVVRTDLAFATIEARWRDGGNAEYEALRVVTPGDFRVHADAPDILPTTAAMLRSQAS